MKIIIILFIGFLTFFSGCTAYVEADPYYPPPPHVIVWGPPVYFGPGPFYPMHGHGPMRGPGPGHGGRHH